MFRSFNKGGLKIVAVLTAGLFVSACQTTKLGGEVKAVTEAEQPLVFNGPGLEGGYRSFTSGPAVCPVPACSCIRPVAACISPSLTPPLSP